MGPQRHNEHQRGRARVQVSGEQWADEDVMRTSGRLTTQLEPPPLISRAMMNAGRPARALWGIGGGGGSRSGRLIIVCNLVRPFSLASNTHTHT